MESQTQEITSDEARAIVAGDVREKWILSHVPRVWSIVERWFLTDERRREGFSIGLLALVEAYNYRWQVTTTGEGDEGRWVGGKVISALRVWKRTNHIISVPWMTYSRAIAEGRVDSVRVTRASFDTVLLSARSVDHVLGNLVVEEFLESLTSAQRAVLDMLIAGETVIGFSKRTGFPRRWVQDEIMKMLSRVWELVYEDLPMPAVVGHRKIGGPLS